MKLPLEISYHVLDEAAEQLQQGKSKVDLLAPVYHSAYQAGHLLHIRGVTGAQESQPILLTAPSWMHRSQYTQTSGVKPEEQ